MTGSRAWHLASRPSGLPDMSHFELKPVDLPPLADGEARVENIWLSVDPYMRGRMNDVKSYVPPFEVGAPLQGGAVGKVVESRSPDLKVGDTVFHMMGWREQASGPAASFNKVPAMGVADEQWLGNLGLTGATAYFGLLRVAEAKEGDIVFVSAAAGAVGSAVVQIAKARGMTVIGYIMRVIAARIRMQGFIYTDYMAEMDQFYRDMGGWIASGRVKSRETVREGIEAAPGAFLDLFSGGNMGKMLVRL